MAVGTIAAMRSLTRPSNFHSKNVKHVKNKVNLVNLHMNHMILNTNSGCFGVSETALNIMVCT